MRSLVAFALFALTLPGRAQDSVRAQDGHSDSARAALVSGVDAFKAGHYEEAAADFQSAVDTEPTWRTARVYLGTALSYQVVPNLDTAENVSMANRAIGQFNQLLASNPQDLEALHQVAALQRNIKRFEEALVTERKIVAIDPNDADARYTIGVLKWTNAYKFAVQTLADESLQDDGNGNARMSAASCAALVAHNTVLVDDGIAELTGAVEIRPAYDDAMQYLNLMYRRRADLDCNNPAQREKDLETANEWIRRAMEARRTNEQQKLEQARDSSGK
jgi:tetratricopeptide (TPR) repeat protein